MKNTDCSMNICNLYKMLVSSTIAVAIFALCLWPVSIHAEGYLPDEVSAVEALDASALGALVIQDAGRLKPLDTFARKILLGFHGKQRLGSDPAMNWMLQMLCDPEEAQSRKIFTIRTPAVVEALGVTALKGSRYSLDDIFSALTDHEPYIRALQEREAKQLDETEKQLVQLYQQISMYLSYTRSLSCFWPDILVDDEAVAQAFSTTKGSYHSYYFFVSQRSEMRVRNYIDMVDAEKKKDPSYDNSGLQNLGTLLSARLKDDSADSLMIIPAVSDAEGATWRSAWSLLNSSQFREQDRAIMDALNNLVTAGFNYDQEQLDAATPIYLEAVGASPYIGLELIYNKADLFYKSLYFYLGALVLLMVFWMHHSRVWYRISFALLSCGGVLHIIGVVMRCTILGRPPVSTLYESIIFAGLIAVIFGLAIEWKRRDTTALLAAVLIGISLQFIGFSYASEGDTLGMLQAVLNNTFWLATHVVTIIIGYGASLVAGIYGHILLARYIFNADAKKQNAQLLKTARGVALVALFFTTLGTILGGIWADQSWGRFWGWDPKENGALLIVLWLLIAIHGFISGEIKKVGFAGILALTNICVAVAWFGVNLLSVGLHSYGFSDSTALSLLGFCVGEFVLVLTAVIYLKFFQGAIGPRHTADPALAASKQDSSDT